MHTRDTLSYKRVKCSCTRRSKANSQGTQIAQAMQLVTTKGKGKGHPATGRGGPRGSG